MSRGRCQVSARGVAELDSAARRPGRWIVAARKTAERHDIKVSGRRVTFYTGSIRRGRLTVPAAYVPHPASLRLTTKDKARVVAGLSAVLSELP
jgi:hypothetical protein